MRAEDKISAIVVTYFSGDILRDSLEKLLASRDCGEVILVNNGNPAEVVASLETWSRQEPRLTLITGHGNIGFGRACNLGARHAHLPILAFVNPDCLVEPGTLHRLGQIADSPGLVLVGGHIRDQQGLEQRGGRRGTLSLWSAIVSFCGLGRAGEQAGLWRDFNRHREPLPTEPTKTPVISGALMATRRDVFWQIGGFDEAYFLHVEDIDLCHRYGLAGGEVLFDPKATATHIGATSDTPSWRVEIAKLHSFLYYFWKFARPPFGHVGVIFVAPFLMLGILIRFFSSK